MSVSGNSFNFTAINLKKKAVKLVLLDNYFPFFSLRSKFDIDSLSSLVYNHFHNILRLLITLIIIIF